MGLDQILVRQFDWTSPSTGLKIRIGFHPKEHYWYIRHSESSWDPWMPEATLRTYRGQDPRPSWCDDHMCRHTKPLPEAERL